jgi:hypothetical protein
MVGFLNNAPRKKVENQLFVFGRLIDIIFYYNIFNRSAILLTNEKDTSRR